MNIAKELKDIEEAILNARPSRDPAAAEVQPVARASVQAGRLEPIAIIGLSGVFPKSDSVDRFSKSLDRDDPLIEAMPPCRFEWRPFYDPTGKTQGKSLLHG